MTSGIEGRAWAFLLVGASAATVSCGSGDDARAADRGEGAARVMLGAADVATVGRARLTSGVPVSGSLQPRLSVTIGSPLGEQLVAVMADEGTAVRAGQPLARFQSAVLEAQLRSAEAAVAATDLEVRLAQAEADRTLNLFREGAIPQRDRDNALLALGAATSRQALAAAQAASAGQQLEVATVRAPASGVISRRYVQAGGRPGIGDPLFDLVNTSSLELEATVPTERLGAVVIGRPVSFAVAQLGGTAVTGRISRINPTADPATRQVKVYVVVPNPGGALVGGLFATGRVIEREAPSALAVPRAAVRREGDAGETVAYVIERGVVARRPVRVGLSDEVQGLVEILSGLAEGETVIVGPIEALEPGTPVEIAPLERPAPGTPAPRPAGPAR